MLVGVILLVGVIVGGLTYVITKLVVSKKENCFAQKRKLINQKQTLKENKAD